MRLSHELTLYSSIKHFLVLFVNHVSFTVSVTGSDARGLFCSCFFLKSLKNSFQASINCLFTYLLTYFSSSS